MEISDIKKALAGLCLATLVSGAGTCFAAGESGSESGAGGTEPQKKEAGKTG